jgi:hypothetical protein
LGALKGSLGQKVYLDANFFIYALEALEIAMLRWSDLEPALA